METVDSDGVIRDNAGTPVDRIEGGTLARARREFNGIPPTTVLMGAVIVVLFGLFLGWYLFHSRTSTAKFAPATAPGSATTMPQREAITEEQARQALIGPPVQGLPGQPTGLAPGQAPVGPGGQQVPVGMTAADGRAGGPALQGGPATGQRPVNPRVALDLASRRSPIMGFANGLGNPVAGQAGRGEPEMNGVSGSATGGAIPISAEGQGPTPGAPGPAAGAAQDGVSSQLAHHVIETARATVVPNRAFLLSAGTLVPCTLQTAINSTQAGYVSCVIGHDVYSEDGRVILLDKGTKVLGQYSGGINQGQARLFVLWTRALTPRGVAIDLGSPAADDLGRAGMAGGVDTMFWQRFGGALMLSVLEDLGNLASSHFANGGTQTTQVPSSTASTALQNTINIKPILKKNQGDQVAIFVAKDFDFSSVYDVHVRR